MSSKSAAYFNKLADSTSALLLIILASLVLLCLAAEDRAFMVSGGILMSSMKTFSTVTPDGTLFMIIFLDF